MKRVFGLVIFVCLPILYAGAQSTTTSRISGIVQDSSGSVVSGAQIQITNVDTNAIRTTQSRDDGSYTFQSLAIGPYKLQATKEGFVTFVQTGIVLQVNTNPEINMTLQVGAVTQTVEVQANAAMVETQSTGVGQVIQPEQVVNLPLNGRQATQLILLSGAAAVVSPDSLGVSRSAGGNGDDLDYPGAVAYSVAGSQSNATNYYLDGAVNMDFRTNIGLPMPFPDALQEFKVELSALPANLGSRPGGAVNAATKSGTNAFHGDVFEFLRNGILDADQHQFPSIGGVVPPGIRDNLRRNQFGGVIGGPIRKDKLFFFAGFQGTTERQQSQPTTAQIPTAANLLGDFSATMAPPCQDQQYLNTTYATTATSNILKPGFMNTPSALVAQNILAFLPPPSAALDACGTYVFAPRTHDNEFQGVLRTDWQRTKADTLFFRYFISDYFLLPFLAGPKNIVGSVVGNADRAQSVAIGDTHILSPRAISSLRLSFARTAITRQSPPGIPTITQLGCNCTSQIQDEIGAFYDAPGSLGYDYENVFGISESIELSMGPHQLTMGFNGMHVQMNNDGLYQVNPELSFTGGTSSVTGGALADFLTGNPDFYHQGNGQLGRDSQNIPSLFFQDNWKVTRHFLVNAGLRWDPFIPQYNKYKMASDFSLAAFNAGAVTSQFSNAPPGVTFPGDKGFNGKSDTQPRIWDFSPRLGIVWDPRGEGRETIRAGYGVFYDTSVLWHTMHIVLNPPWGETLNFTPVSAQAGGGLANPWFGQPGGNPFPTPLNPPSNFVFPINGQYVFEDQNIKPTNVQQWNLAFQMQLGRNWLVSATYIGNKTTHLWLGRDLNYPVYLSQYGTSLPCTLPYEGVNITWPTCNGTRDETQIVSIPGQPQPISVSNQDNRRVLTLANPIAGPLYNGGLVMDRSEGSSAYNGLLLSAQHRVSNNFSMLTNFTWSHCMNDADTIEDIHSFSQDPTIPKDWGNCASDRRKIFNLLLIVDSPKRGSRFVQMLAGNWHGSGIFTASTGSWISVLDNQDVALSGRDQRPDIVGNPFTPGPVAANPTCVAPTSVHNITTWFNPCAYMLQAAGTYGNSKRNSLQGPGNWNFDAAFWRTFPIRESLQLDFRAEAFNVFNHTRIGNPETTLVGGNPGRISSSAAPRIMQVALKLTF